MDNRLIVVLKNVEVAFLNKKKADYKYETLVVNLTDEQKVQVEEWIKRNKIGPNPNEPDFKYYMGECRYTFKIKDTTIKGAMNEPKEHISRGSKINLVAIAYDYDHDGKQGVSQRLTDIYVIGGDINQNVSYMDMIDEALPGELHDEPELIVEHDSSMKKSADLRGDDDPVVVRSNNTTDKDDLEFINLDDVPF